ncbi:14854_t:CDS:1 [Dentiscutata erythropus]|uniref:14854_t:CDS:1 n=1 Tax=Dentiscutata erythropus TaxID=1348616 RepID=A0A9N9JM83_9GLOM|nr:14854_t:CDS:1 [Dentiscutata erythropus]
MVRRYVDKLEFTLKRLTVIPHKRNTPETILARENYIRKIYEKSIDIHDNIIYIDETGFNLHLSSSRGHALCGQPAIKVVETQREKNITVITAITKDSVLKYSSNLGSTNADIFSKFIEDLIALISKIIKNF